MIEVVIGELDSKARAEVYSDDDCLLLVEFNIEVVSWKPVEIKQTGPGRVLLVLRATGTELVLDLKTWGVEMPGHKGEKRLLKSEQEAVGKVWGGLTERYPAGEDLLAQVNPEEVVAKHRAWLERDREA